MVIDYLVTLGFDIIKDKIQDDVKGKKLEKGLREYLEKELEHNESSLREDELDFEGLEEYIYKGFLDDARGCLMEQNIGKRHKAEEAILRRAKEYAQAQEKLSAERAEKLISNALEILKKFYLENTDPSIRILLGELANGLGEQVTKLGAQIAALEAPIQQMNESLDNLLSKEQFPMDEYIAFQKVHVRTQTIFPWFNDSPKYQEVFPQLFVTPRLEERGAECQLDDLLWDVDRNLMVLGDFGSGKSTLLRYVFLFSERNNCVYLTAKDAESTRDDGLLAKIIASAWTSQKQLLVFIDGIDEAFHNDPQGFRGLIARLKTALNCHFWLGCRTDFYKRAYGESVAFAEKDITILPWTPEQAAHFIHTYASIRKKKQLEEHVERLVGMSSQLEKFKTNPFQLALLVFLAENDENAPVLGTYDLYERFIQRWLEREQKRETCLDDNRTILNVLREAASKIYDNQPFFLDEYASRNTAVKDLLVLGGVNIYNEPYAVAFYHRSLVAFLLAQKTIEAMLENDTRQLKDIFFYKLKDDVTNFIGDCFATLSIQKKIIIKNNLQNLYQDIAENSPRIQLQEQIVYFITRLGIDVSDFLLRIIRSDPVHPIMRLTLAYGCALSDVSEIRSYALEYAKSLASESIDTITNRAWTVIYFGDVEGNPYQYQDNEKSPWKYAREARIKRFTKKNPRLKDYRFRLFDIPLFHSFLKDRGWNDVTVNEYEILKAIDMPEDVFNSEEIEFLLQQKTLLLTNYAQYLGEHVRS